MDRRDRDRDRERDRDRDRERDRDRDRDRERDRERDRARPESSGSIRRQQASLKHRQQNIDEEQALAAIPESERYGRKRTDVPASSSSAVASAASEGADASAALPKEKPNFGISGALAADINTYKGVVLKYSEPVEARKPTHKYRLYVFKGSEQIDLLHVHRQSAFLFGRERLVADIPIDHPSCSKQHAVLQFRQIVSTNEFGESTKAIKPYLIDLESGNGTFVNGDKIPTSRYFEVKAGDVIKFGFSTREYVLMIEEMADS
eukprot:jgi/Hompol1/804/HPOL_005419-RA